MSELVTEEYHCEVCCSCEIKFWIPMHLYLTALSRREAFSFYCPNGHDQHYLTDERDTPTGDGDGDDGEKVVKFQVVKGDKL